MPRSALSIAVPLDGTDVEPGLRQLQKYSSGRPTIRSQYRRFKGPFLEYLDIDHLKQGCKNWNQFLGYPKGNIRRQIEAYSIPGSIVALCERTEENLVEYTVNYLQVVLCVLLMMLGPFRVILLSIMIMLYYGIRDSDEYILEPWDSIRTILLQFVYPVATVLLIMTTNLAAVVSFATLLGAIVVLLHAAFHRAPSEFRNLRQNRLVRSLRRHRRPVDGARLLWKDALRYMDNSVSEFNLWLQWKMLHVRDYLGLLRLTINQRLEQKSRLSSMMKDGK